MVGVSKLGVILPAAILSDHDSADRIQYFSGIRGKDSFAEKGGRTTGWHIFLQLFDIQIFML